MKKDDAIAFCLEETIPGISKALENETKNILDAVIKKANRDTLSGARFWDKGYSKNSKYSLWKGINQARKRVNSIKN